MRPMDLFHVALLFTLAAVPLYGQGTYPLQVGNVWQYEDRWDSLYRFTTRAVADTLMPNGHLYTMLVSSYELDTLFFRQDSSRVYNYAKHRITDSTYWRGDELWYDFSKTFLDTVTVRYYRSVIGGHEYTDTVVVTVSGDGYASVFGQTRRLWGFYEKSLQTSMYAIRNVADGIGMTFYQYEPGWFSYDLKGAIINGVPYGTITDVIGTAQSSPAAYALSQNYPNPFNPSTAIRFQITDYGPVSLKIFDVLGREVATLVNEVKQPGEYTVRWDAGNYPSGVYVYRLRTSSGLLTRRMMLLK